jgi:hypothetical protein
VWQSLPAGLPETEWARVRFQSPTRERGRQSRGRRPASCCRSSVRIHAYERSRSHVRDGDPEDGYGRTAPEPVRVTNSLRPRRERLSSSLHSMRSRGRGAWAIGEGFAVELACIDTVLLRWSLGSRLLYGCSTSGALGSSRIRVLFSLFPVFLTRAVSWPTPRSELRTVLDGWRKRHRPGGGWREA